MVGRIRPGRWLAVAAMITVFTGCPATKVEYVDVKKSADRETIAVLTVPSYIEVRSIDDQVVEEFYTRVLYSGERKIHLPPGAHAVVLRYNDIWDIDQYDHKRIRSDYIGISFEAGPGGSYRVRTHEPFDRAEAEELASDFTAWIVDQRTGKKVSE